MCSSRSRERNTTTRLLLIRSLRNAIGGQGMCDRSELRVDLAGVADLPAFARVILLRAAARAGDLEAVVHAALVAGARDDLELLLLVLLREHDAHLLAARLVAE